MELLAQAESIAGGKHWTPAEIAGLITAVGATFTAAGWLGNWLLGKYQAKVAAKTSDDKNRNDHDIEATKLANQAMQTVIETWRKDMDGLKQDNRELKKEAADCARERAANEVKFAVLEAAMKQCHDDHAESKKERDELRIKVVTLEGEFQRSGIRHRPNGPTNINLTVGPPEPTEEKKPESRIITE